MADERGRHREGSWADTYVAHFPRAKRRQDGPFERGVGLEGYDRGTGVAVPKHPRLQRPGEVEPVADPFEDEATAAVSDERTEAGADSAAESSADDAGEGTKGAATDAQKEGAPTDAQKEA